MPNNANPTGPPDDSQVDGQPEPDADDQGGGMDETEVCVPLQSLAMPGEGGESSSTETPAVGDKVQMAIEGEVSRIEGDNAYVTMEAVNGQPIEQNQQPSDDQELQNLQQMAQGMPDRY